MQFIFAANLLWDFNNSLDYTYGANIEVSAGSSHLKQIDSSIIDDTQAEFDLGSYNNTVFDTDHIELNTNIDSGEYQSKIFDFGNNVSYDNLSWLETLNLYNNWYDNNWQKRKVATVDNSLTASNLIDYQIRLEVNYDSDMNADFSDLRFTDSDGTTPIDFWVQSYISGTSAVVWVEVPNIPASNTSDIYMYYGNNAAVSASNGENTFLLFDDFDDGNIDVGKWLEVDPNNEMTESAGKLHFVRLSSSVGWTKGIIANTTFPRSNLSLEADYKWENNNSSWDAIMFGWHDSGTNPDFRNLVYGYYNNGISGGTSIPVTVYEDGTGRSASGNWVLNQDYDIRVRIKQGGGAYYERSIDNGLNWEISLEDTYSTETNLKPAWAFHSGTHSFDNVRVRKWTDNEPTLTFSNEQKGIDTTDIKIQIRSCDDSLCDTEIFVGPDGTNATFFTTNTGELMNIINNRYFQYKIFFSGDGTLSSELSLIKIDYHGYDTSIPTIIPNNSLTIENSSKLISFIENSTKDPGSEVYYQLSNDDGLNWKYFNGSSWVNVVGPNDYNVSSDINTNINTFPTNSTQILFKAFFESDGLAQAYLNEVTIESQIQSSSSSGSSGFIKYVCKDKSATNYNRFGRHKESLCEYDNKKDENIIDNVAIINNGDVICSIIKQNLKYGDVDGEYSSWQKGVVSEIKVLQKDMNILGFDVGDVDGFFGKKTKDSIKKMQLSFGLDQDGLVGPNTRSLINKSCSEDVLPVEDSIYISKDVIDQVKDLKKTIDLLQVKLDNILEKFNISI